MSNYLREFFFFNFSKDSRSMSDETFDEHLDYIGDKKMLFFNFGNFGKIKQNLSIFKSNY